MRMMIHPEEVIAFRSVAAEYADVPPFHPGESYPESMFSAIGSEPNPAYAGVRECFRLAGLDQAHFGTSQWNPLGDLMNPGDSSGMVARTPGPQASPPYVFHSPR